MRSAEAIFTSLSDKPVLAQPAFCCGSDLQVFIFRVTVSPAVVLTSPTMIFGASGRGGGAVARLFFTATVLVLCLAVSWAGVHPETEKAKPAEGNPPVLTLGTLITGTYREIQRYAESAMGIGVIRSAVEVQSAATPWVSPLFSSYLLFQPFGLTSLFDWLMFFNQYLITNFKLSHLHLSPSSIFVPAPQRVNLPLIPSFFASFLSFWHSYPLNTHFAVSQPDSLFPRVQCCFSSRCSDRRTSIPWPW